MLYVSVLVEAHLLGHQIFHILLVYSLQLVCVDLSGVEAIQCFQFGPFLFVELIAE